MLCDCDGKQLISISALFYLSVGTFHTNCSPSDRGLKPSI